MIASFSKKSLIMKKIVLLLLCSSSLFGQKIILNGKLLDKDTGKPVVYANISFIDIQKGVSSLEDGGFSLEVTNEDLKRKVHISCLNYKDTIVQAKDLNKKIVYLTPESYQLEEIVLSNKRKKDLELELKKIRKKDLKIGFGGRVEKPWTIARYFEYEEKYEQTPYLKKITVFTKKYGRRKAKFRVRIFTKNELTGLPEEDLLKENIIVSMGKGDKKAQIDVSEYDIEMPKTGFFVALERLHIPYNFYEYKLKYKDGEVRKVMGVSPDFGSVAAKNEKLFTYLGGKWFSRKGKIVPAISVTLSN